MKKEGWKGVKDRRIVHYRALIGGIEVVVSERKIERIRESSSCVCEISYLFLLYVLRYGILQLLSICMYSMYFMIVCRYIYLSARTH